MSSSRISGGYKFHCDACGEAWQPPRLGAGSEERDWHDCWEACKATGWRAVKVRGRAGDTQWEHRCKECV